MYKYISILIILQVPAIYFYKSFIIYKIYEYTIYIYYEFIFRNTETVVEGSHKTIYVQICFGHKKVDYVHRNVQLQVPRTSFVLFHHILYIKVYINVD